MVYSRSKPRRARQKSTHDSKKALDPETFNEALVIRTWQWILKLLSRYGSSFNAWTERYTVKGVKESGSFFNLNIWLLSCSAMDCSRFLHFKEETDSFVSAQHCHHAGMYGIEHWLRYLEVSRVSNRILKPKDAKQAMRINKEQFRRI